jgi:uncharacterized membrane protein
MTETRARSFAKAISYRAVSSIVTGSILFGVTQKGWLSLGVALMDSVVKTTIFYLHERTWTMIGVQRAAVKTNRIHPEGL